MDNNLIIILVSIIWLSIVILSSVVTLKYIEKGDE